jgi:glycosyltransferase involved in cell wall biosynthesis
MSKPKSSLPDNLQDNPNTKLRVLQVGPTSLPGGVANVIKSLCISLQRLGNELNLVTNDGDDVREMRAKGVTCYVTDFSSRPAALLHSSLQLRRIFKSFRPNVVHVHGRSGALRCIAAGRAADWFSLHNAFLTHQVGFYDVGFIRKYFSPWGKNFFVLDHLAANYLQKHFGVRPESIVQTFNGVDCERFRPPSISERLAARARFEVATEDVFVVFVGRLHPSKQPHAVVAAAVRAKESHRKDLKFALIGDGELRNSLTAAIAEAGVGALCKLYDWMDPLDAYFAADLVVMPSLFEGYGLVAAEAIATGCPVLRSRTAGSSHQIREGISGFECEIESGTFVEKLFQLLEAPERFRAMRPLAREFALPHLGEMSAARQIVSEYRARMAIP